MLEPARTAALFADARLLYDEAIELLELGKLRIAAEAAWGATKRATDALILARTGREPRTAGQTNREMYLLSRTEQSLVVFKDEYRYRARTLHGRCFYDGEYETDEIVSIILQTENLIRDLEQQASGN